MKNDSDAAQTATKRKRDAADAGPNKKKGRPRLAPQDETAAERRRTQIRLAQRAYRQRKESTITELQDHVHNLESSLIVMRQSFQELTTCLVGENVSSEVAKKISLLSKELAEASGRFMSREEDENTNPHQYPAVLDAECAPDIFLTPSKPQPQTDLLSLSDSIPEVPRDIGLGYCQFYEGIPGPEAVDGSAPLFFPMNNSSSDQDSQGQNANTMALVPKRDFVHGPRLDGAHHFMPMRSFNSSIGKQLSPYSVSFQETTFAKRLRRASVECGFHLLSPQYRKSPTFRRVFGLPSLWVSPDVLIEKFRTTLRINFMDDQEPSHFPGLRLGGAGTHYDRPDESDIFLSPNTYHLVPISPGNKLARIQSISDGSYLSDVVVDSTGLEGDWFDHYDVQGYLMEKGLRFGPGASYAEMDVEDWDKEPLMLPPSPGQVISWDPATSLPSPPTPSVYFHDLEKAVAEKSSLNDMPLFGNDALELPISKPTTPSEPTISTATDPGVFSVSELNTQYLCDGSYPSLENYEGPLAASEPPPRMSSGVQDSLERLFPELSQLPSAPQPPTTQTTSQIMETSIAVSEPLPVLPRKRTVTISIQKLIAELLKGGICLGRSPGFSKSAVDMALRVAAC